MPTPKRAPFKVRDREARRHQRSGTVVSPAAGAISHATDGRAYTRDRQGCIRRAPRFDGAPKIVRRARTMRDWLASIRAHERAA